MRKEKQSVIHILKKMDHTDCTVNFKTYTKFYKLKKRLENPRNLGRFSMIHRSPIITMGVVTGITEKQMYEYENQYARLIFGGIFCVDARANSAL